jgi:3'(2'), 5'-bisphosphate nucleotidase
LDGTKEFIKRNGEFTVNIALVRNSVPVLGVIYIPMQRELYFAAEGAGAYKASHIAGWADISAMSVPELMAHSERLPRATAMHQAFVVVASRSHLSPETEAYISDQQAKHGQVEIRTSGSSIKICLVAEGVADVYPRFAPTMEWDTAAGHAISRMAGCEIYQAGSDEPLRYNKEELLNPWFVVERVEGRR